MALYTNRRLVIFDADGTLIDAFQAIEQTFLQHDMDIGDLERFQKRRKLLKFLGGLREFPGNLRKQFGKQSRNKLLATLTEHYRENAVLYPGMATLVRTLLSSPGIQVGVVTRNVTIDPETTLRHLFRRHDIDADEFNYFACIPLGEDKTVHLKLARESLSVNPARTFACGDEYSDYAAAISAGVYPFVVSYGFEDHEKLTKNFGLPPEIILRTPAEFRERLTHALDLD